MAAGSARSARTARRRNIGTLAAAMLRTRRVRPATIGYAHAATEEQAVTQALINCNEWQGFCALAVVAPKGNCVALATRGTGEEYNGGSGRDRGSDNGGGPRAAVRGPDQVLVLHVSASARHPAGVAGPTCRPCYP